MDNNEQLNRLEDKVDKISDVMTKQEINLSRLTTTVEIHVERSNKLEGIVLPIQTKMNYVEGALKLLGALAVVAAICEALFIALQYFKH